MLTLELDLLTDVYRASLPDGLASEWPPHVDRIFSALVQAWSDGGKDDAEHGALEWLEKLGPPKIEANAPADTWERDAPINYVPPNDVSGGTPVALPDRRERRDRRFRARVPADPRVRVQWAEDVPTVHRAPLDALVRRVASVGHSSSFARCSIRCDVVVLDETRIWERDPDGAHAIRGLYAGRFADLEAAFARAERPRSPVTIRYRAPPPSSENAPRRTTPDAPARPSAFGPPADWFVFAHHEGEVPDILGFAHVAARARAALMSHAEEPIPTVLSGHAAEGGPASATHIAIVPLANVGFARATGDLLGFAVVLPRVLAPEMRAAALGALASFAGLKSKSKDPTAMLRLTSTWEWIVKRQAASAVASLKPERWCAPARTWASVTPVILDRYARNNDPIEEAQIIASACRHIGLPEPASIEIHKHSSVRGAPTCYPDRGIAHRIGWSFPEGSKLRARARRHVVLTFDEPVAGPVFLGAGRYYGFGMCLPFGEDESA